MKPVKLEIFLDDKTLAGMRSVEGNMTHMEVVSRELLKRLKLELKELEAQYKALEKQGLAGDKELADIQALQGAVAGLKEQLKEYAAAKKQADETPVMGDDPAPKLNSLKTSMAQIARELPALAMGPQMFFLAISNNLPVLQDALASARKEYERMTAAGQKATPVWKQMAASLFSPQTALAALITLTVVYGKEIGEWIKGLVKAKDATTGLLSAEQEMALARSKASEGIKRERAELDILYAKLKDTSLSTKERTAAVNEWIRRYPEHAGILDGEQVSLSRLETAYQALSREIYAHAVARQYTDKVADLSVKREKEEIKRLNQKATLLKAQQRVEQAEAEQAAARQMRQKGLYGSGSRAAAANDELAAANKDLERQQRIYDGIADTVKHYDESIRTIAGHVDALNLFPQPEEGTYDYWKQQQERAEGALKEIKADVKKTLDDAAREGADLFSLGIDKSVVETYRQATDRIKEARKNLKAYDDGGGQPGGGSGRTDYQTELSAARLRARQKVEAARIAVMQEGYSKRKALAAKEYDDTLAAIDREERDTLARLEKARQAGGQVAPEEERRVKDDASSQRILAQMQYLQESYGIEKEWREKDRQAWIDYNKEYGTYQEKRLAIAQDYALKIGQAATEGEKASLKKRRDEDLKELDFGEFKKSVNLADVFGSLDEQSTEALALLRDKLKEYINGAAKELRPSDLKELQEALTRIDTKLVDRRPFQELKRSLDDYGASQQAVEKAQEELNTVTAGGQVVAGTYTDETGRLVARLLTQEQAEKNLAAAQSDRLKKQAALARSLQGVAGEMSSYGQAAGTVISTLEGFGLDIDENVKNVVEGFNTMSEGISQFADSLLSLDIGGMIGGVFNILGGAVRSIGSLFGADWGGQRSEKRYQQAKEKYESYMEVLDKVIAKQKELVASMEADDFANADNSYEKAREMLKKQQDYAREMGKAYLKAGASKGFLGIGSSASHGTDQRKDISSAAWAQAREVLGGDFDRYGIGSGRMTGLFDLSYEQLVKLRDEATGFWSELHEDTRTYLEQVIESEEAWREVQEARKEALTKTDFDGFYDSFVSLLSDMDATSEEFADSFEEYLQNAIFSALVATQYKERIQRLYDSWADMADKDGLSSAEADRLREEYRKIIDEMLAQREQVMKDFGWTASEEGGQSGRSGAFTTLTQEQGTKLEGLFTSLQDHAAGIHGLLEELKRGRDADYEIYLQIAENTAFCRLLADILELLEKQERDGVRLKD